VRKELETAKKSKDEGKSSSKDVNSKSKLEAAQKQLDELKSQHASVEKEVGTTLTIFRPRTNVISV
jgi:hypothetical protein